MAGGWSTGFDYLRIILACLVVISHSVSASYGAAVLNAIAEGPARPVFAVVLPMFFALSGFLVAGSLARSRTLVMFMGLRVIRLGPALAVEVLLSALILGPIFTTLSLGEYVSDPLFARYFMNLWGHVQFELPGVFADNPLPSVVNAQLWTIPYELYCYITLGVLALIGATRRRIWLLVALAALQLANFGWDVFRGVHFDVLPGHVDGSHLLISGLAGFTLYFYRDKVVWDGRLFALSAGAALIALTTPIGDFVAPLPIAYATVYLGLLNPPKARVLQGADYSYGLFLYGLVVEQALAALGVRYWYAMAPLTILIGGAFAAASWHFVERPAFALRRPLKRLEDRWLFAKGMAKARFLPRLQKAPV